MNKLKVKENTLDEKNEDDAVIYIYIDKIVNLSKKHFTNLSFCVRFYKDEKYTYKSFDLKNEMIFDTLLSSKKKLCDMQEVIIEVWHEREVDKKKRKKKKEKEKEKKKKKNMIENNMVEEKVKDCVGILKINVKEINENKNIMYLEKYNELTFRFYDDINFMFRVLLIRGLKDMYSNIFLFCKKYIENYEIDSRNFLLKDKNDIDPNGINIRKGNIKKKIKKMKNINNVNNINRNDNINSSNEYDVRSNSFLSISEQYFMYDSTNIYNNEYYIYEIQREVLKKGIRSNVIINGVLKRMRQKMEMNNVNKEISKRKFNTKNVDSDHLSELCKYVMNDSYDELDHRENMYTFKMNIMNKEKTKNKCNNNRKNNKKNKNNNNNENKRENYNYSYNNYNETNSIYDDNIYYNNRNYLNIDFVKEELLLWNMNEEVVNLLICDIKTNCIKDKYILKSFFEEYIEKIYTKWEKLSNKIFVKNKKNMNINDICEYIDSLYIDDENYINKEEFFLFFEDIGTIFVDSNIFDELCLLFYDKKKELIHFSLFVSLIIKKGVEELKNMIYGYDILLKLFDFLYMEHISMEYLENELFKISLDKKNFYSEKIKKNISRNILIDSNINYNKNKKPNDNLYMFLNEEDNICSCTSLHFLHSISFILKKFNNNNFTTYDLFFLVKYIIQNQNNYVLSDTYIFVNVIKGIETINITYFLSLYYIYINQNKNNIQLRENQENDTSEKICDDNLNNVITIERNQTLEKPLHSLYNDNSLCISYSEKKSGYISSYGSVYKENRKCSNTLGNVDRNKNVVEVYHNEKGCINNMIKNDDENIPCEKNKVTTTRKVTNEF
ncbi:hypothetical protein PFFVO_06154, partial [Plasmodium falciparum Vietnam Oak-Knoll (FVO)]